MYLYVHTHNTTPKVEGIVCTLRRLIVIDGRHRRPRTCLHGCFQNIKYNVYSKNALKKFVRNVLRSL